MASEMLTRHPLAYFALVVSSFFLLSLSGCERDLGDCNLDGTTDEGRPIDGPAAFDLVYRGTDGLPMYEGQALVQSTCGNAQFCHSPVATGGERFGVPAGLDFDVALACSDETVDSTCANLAGCEVDPQSDYCQRLERLDTNRSRINSWAGDMIAEIRNGAMPPGEAGRVVRDDTPWFRPDGSQLPSIDSSESTDIVRNWLACASPVVVRTEFPPNPELELTPCSSIEEETCVYSGPQGDLPDPTWSSIYASLIFNQCLICHGPANANVDQNPDNPNGEIPGGASPQGLAALDLSGVDLMDTSNWASDSYPAVFDVPASPAGECEGQGIVVVPNDSAGSLMVQKMRAVQTCGSPMPVAPGQTIPNAIIDIVSEWIDAGALND